MSHTGTRTRARTRARLFQSVLFFGLVVSTAPPLHAQSCAYRDLLQAVTPLASVLDTFPLQGSLHVTVGAGRPARLGMPARAECRMAALWTSRGDSLIVHRLSIADSLATITPPPPLPALQLADQPRPFQYDQAATYGAPDIMRSAILAASRAAGGQPRQSAALMILVDTTGRALNVRLIKSSLLRELDEAALRIYSTTQYHPAEDDGRPVRAWLMAELHWPGSAQSPTPLPQLQIR